LGPIAVSIAELRPVGGGNCLIIEELITHDGAVLSLIKLTVIWDGCPPHPLLTLKFDTLAPKIKSEQ